MKFSAAARISTPALVRPRKSERAARRTSVTPIVIRSSAGMVTDPIEIGFEIAPETSTVFVTDPKISCARF